MTAAARQKRRRDRGAHVSTVISDPAAIAALRAAQAAHGGITAGITAALIAWGTMNAPAAAPDPVMTPRTLRKARP